MEPRSSLLGGTVNPRNQTANIPRTLCVLLQRALGMGVCSLRALAANYVQPRCASCHQHRPRSFVNSTRKTSPLSLTPRLTFPMGHNLSGCPNLCSPNCNPETPKDVLLLYFRASSSPMAVEKLGAEAWGHCPGAEASSCAGHRWVEKGAIVSNESTG